MGATFVSMRQIPVGCVQLRAHDRRDFPTVFPRIVERVRQAGRAGARLVVLPEGTVPAYVLGPEPAFAEELERAIAALADVARECALTLVVGAAKIERERTYNAAIVVGPDGDVIGHAAKQFLWHFDRRWFAAGETLDPIDTPAGRLGVLVCADGRIPTIAATLAERGAEILVMPTAWVTSGRDPAALENLQADLLANVRARENALPFVVCNKVGVERGSVAYCGKSAIIDGSGAFVARASERDDETIAGTVTLGASRPRAREPRTFDASLAANGTPLAARVRIAFTVATERDRIAEFATLAALADADLLLTAPHAADAGNCDLPILRARDGVVRAGGVRALGVSDEDVTSPRGLVPARLAGIDLFVWEAHGDDAWHVRFARTRAAELRAFVVVFARVSGRAFAVDPDGIVVAGTFDAFETAAFVYDTARCAAGVVAPFTDVARGLRDAEGIRAKGLRTSLSD